LCSHFHYSSSCVWVPILWTRLALHSGAHLENLPCIAFGYPSCELTLCCIWVPNLGEAVLKNLPPRQNWFLSILWLVFLPCAPLCGCFCYSSSCVWVPILWTSLELCLGTQFAKSFVSSFFLVLPCVVVFVWLHNLSSYITILYIL